MNPVKKTLWLLLLALPPLFATLYSGATGVVDGQMSPWTPVMLDLDVYQRTGHLVLEGKPFYVTKDWLPFIYPPFAALLAVPLAFVGQIPAQVIWLVLNAFMMMALIHRLGFKGWYWSAITTAAIWFVEPVRTTLGFGQVNLFICGMVALDLIPGPRLFRKRLLPQGWLIGIATAIKLTPALFAVYLFLSGRIKPALVAFGSFCVVTLIGFIALPSQSVLFWTRLVGGDSGMNATLKYFTNQSVFGVWVRFAEVDTSHSVPKGAYLVAAVVALLGLAGAVLWQRLGRSSLAFGVCAITALLVNPISWSHHWVWVVPFALLLIRDTKIPGLIRGYGIVYSVWICFAPFNEFGDGRDEFTYTFVTKLIDAGNAIFGIGFLVLTLAIALTERRRLGLPPLPLTLRAHEKGGPALESDAESTHEGELEGGPDVVGGETPAGGSTAVAAPKA